MGTPHIHVELIKAWADGATIQFLHDGKWLDCIQAPAWKESIKYRIKPTTVKLKYGISLHELGGLHWASACTTTAVEASATFVKWITPIKEVEVEL